MPASLLALSLTLTLPLRLLLALARLLSWLLTRLLALAWLLSGLLALAAVPRFLSLAAVAELFHLTADVLGLVEGLLHRDLGSCRRWRRRSVLPPNRLRAS